MENDKLLSYLFQAAERRWVSVKPIIRNAEEAAYILQIPPQAFREQAKRGMNRYSRVAGGKKKRTYEFFPFIAAEELHIPIEILEKRADGFKEKS